MSRYILIKLRRAKHKEKTLKVAREQQQIAYKEILIRLTADISTKTLQVRKGMQNILRLLKGQNLQPRLFLSASISFRFDR